MAYTSCTHGALMRPISPLRHTMLIVLSGIFTSFAIAQVKQPYDGDISIEVTPVAPKAPVTASIDVFTQCTTPTGPSLLKPGIQNSVLDGKDVPLALAAKLTSGGSVCAIETFVGVGALPVQIFTAIVRSVPPVPTSLAAPKSNVVIEPPNASQQYILVDPIAPVAGQAATLEVYAACPAATAPAGTSLLVANQQTDVIAPGATVTLVLAKQLTSGDPLCAVETFTGSPVKSPVSSAAVTVTAAQAPAPATSSITSSLTLTPVRLIGGVDVNAAASTNPAAKFLLDVSFEKPIAKNSPDSWLWMSGYVRLASIAQPGAVSGITNISTYIQPLVASTPSTLVQSAEAEFAVESKLYAASSSNTSTPSSLHFIAEGGIITPLSPNQSNPTPYQVNQALYNYYNNPNATGIAAIAYQAILTACGATFSTTTPCYVAYIPQDRSRFYRNWAAGLRYRDYWPQSSSSKSYFFPKRYDAQCRPE